MSTMPLPSFYVKKILRELNLAFLQVEKLERRESVISTSEDSEFDVDAVVQQANPEQDELKPKLKGRALTVLPAQNKDTEMSGLCSIM